MSEPLKEAYFAKREQELLDKCRIRSEEQFFDECRKTGIFEDWYALT